MNTQTLTFGSIILMLAVGALTGVFSGIFGVGGGVILVPILILVFKYGPQTASGMSLVALLLPVGLLGVLEYFKAGRISGADIRIGLIIAIGLFFGTFLGAKVSASLPSAVLQKVFAVFLVLIAARLWTAV